MEKIQRENIENESFLKKYSLYILSHSRYLFFLIGFVLLIIFSNHYSEQRQLKSPKSASEKNHANYIYSSDKDYPEAKESNTEEEKLVAFAIALIGKKYTPAGKSPSDGFDCSGFTQYVFKNFHIEIPPSSITQSNVGEKVDLKDAKKGDLIFFKSPTFGNNQIGHVGIVISNENKNLSFVHSSTSRGVVIDNLESKHYKSRYKTIRRINLVNNKKLASN